MIWSKTLRYEYLIPPISKLQLTHLWFHMDERIFLKKYTVCHRIIHFFSLRANMFIIQHNTNLNVWDYVLNTIQLQTDIYPFSDTRLPFPPHYPSIRILQDPRCVWIGLPGYSRTSLWAGRAIVWRLINYRPIIRNRTPFKNKLQTI